MSDPLVWLVFLLIAVGSTIGCIQSQNWVGALVWFGFVLAAGLGVLIASRRQKREVERRRRETVL